MKMHQQDYYKGHVPLEKSAPGDLLAKAIAALDKLDAMIDRKVDEVIGAMRKSQDEAAQGSRK
jgi:hypothetical protein